MSGSVSVLASDRRFAPMTREDLDQVLAIEQAGYAFPWTRGNFEDALNSGYGCLCLRQATGELIGYCILMPVVDELHLLNICVAPDLQRSGAALALLREMVAYARSVGGLASVLLEVRASHERAIAIYERFGFLPIGRRRGYYPAHEGREDALVMRLTLDEGNHGLD